MDIFTFSLTNNLSSVHMARVHVYMYVCMYAYIHTYIHTIIDNYSYTSIFVNVYN